MLHEQFDLATWKQVFSLARLREEAQGKPASRQPKANLITGPYDLAVLEQLRDEAFATMPNVERVPTDVFVWALGEPERRDVTKIGGLPYRERGKPWPVAASGAPLTFVAQICFADSSDIVPRLPGDILLIFIEGVDWTEGWEAEPRFTFMWGGNEDENSEVIFEWVSLHDRPLVEAQDIPDIDWQLVPFYGVIHRTWDYLHVDGLSSPGAMRRIPVVVAATKIGGICPWKHVEGPFTSERTEVYLGSLSSLAIISPDYPFLNVPKTNNPELEKMKRSKRAFLMIGDIGLMNLFLSPDGTISWSIRDN